MYQRNDGPSIYNRAIVILCLLGTLVSVDCMVIWRCPEFNLLHCKAIPTECRSLRMIYIRHGDMECPGCLICADYYRNKPLSKDYKKLRLEERKRKRKDRRKRARLRLKLRIRNRLNRKSKNLHHINDKLESKYNDIRFKT